MKAEKKWAWMMDYCKKNNLPPAQSWAWDEAEKEYNKQSILGKFVYEVEMDDSKNEVWKEKEKRYYFVEQNVKDFPDNKMRRNFKQA